MSIIVFIDNTNIIVYGELDKINYGVLIRVYKVYKH